MMRSGRFSAIEASRSLIEKGLSRSRSLRRRPPAGGLLCGFQFLADALRQTLRSRLAIPLFERLVRDLALDEQLREFATLRLTLEWYDVLLSTGI